MARSGTAFHFSSANCWSLRWTMARDWASCGATAAARASTAGKGEKCSGSIANSPAMAGGRPSLSPMARARRTLAWSSMASVFCRASSMRLADSSTSTRLR